jgi:dolichol-phosphate mannosyltransferase
MTVVGTPEDRLGLFENRSGEGASPPPNPQLERSVVAHVDNSTHLSFVIPIYNEEPNIVPLLSRLFETAATFGFPYEVIAVDDGSSDDTFRLLALEAERRPELKVIRFRRNYGQTAAMMAGIDHARGEIVVALDADLQNDPADTPQLLAKLAEGYDVVSGWRRERQDAKFTRDLVSRVASRLLSAVFGVRLHDYGCTLKAYRREIIKDVKLYGEMHRFIPVYAHWLGARVTEIPVRHRPRERGRSKYGLERVVKVVLDMMVVKFLERHFVKPIYVFGGAGLASFVLSLVAIGAALWLRVFQGTPFLQTPLPLLSVLFALGGAGSILMGLLAEMIVRTYFEAQHRPAYRVRESRNL